MRERETKEGHQRKKSRRGEKNVKLRGRARRGKSEVRDERGDGKREGDGGMNQKRKKKRVFCQF